MEEKACVKDGNDGNHLLHSLDAISKFAFLLNWNDHSILYKNKKAESIFLSDIDYFTVYQNYHGEENAKYEITLHDVTYICTVSTYAENEAYRLFIGEVKDQKEKLFDFSAFIHPYLNQRDFDDEIKYLESKNEMNIGLYVVAFDVEKGYSEGDAPIIPLLSSIDYSFEQHKIFTIDFNTFVLISYKQSYEQFVFSCTQMDDFFFEKESKVVRYGHAWCDNAYDIRDMFQIAYNHMQSMKELLKFPQTEGKEDLHDNTENNTEIILVIDKDPNTKQCLEEIFKDKYTICQVFEHVDALPYRTRKVSLILLEESSMSISFLKQIRQYAMFVNIPILVMYEKEEASLAEYYSYGVFHTLKKPLEDTLTYSKIENALRHVDSFSNGLYGTFDRLTSLVSSNYFFALAKGIMNNDRINKDLVLVYINVENFKTFNSLYGYEGGNAFLKELANVLSNTFNNYIVARSSDDHFIILTTKDGVVEKINRVRHQMISFQKDIKVEIKAGICPCEEGVSAIQAHDRAKLACDKTKGNYSIHYYFYDDALRQTILKEKYIADSIDKAIEEGNIINYYQPIQRVFNDHICALEGLARWKDSKYGFISPSEFVPVLEKHYLIHKLDMCIIEQACKDLASIRARGEKLVPVSVNLSRLDFQLMDTYEFVCSVTQKYDIPHSFIHIEITETMLSDDIASLQGVLQTFHDAGFEIWLDDFGSEYSTLNTLQNYSFDLLKIDMKFFSTFDTNKNSKTIIMAIVDMAKRLHMRVLAEGIETIEQYKFLKQIGCDKAQGYFICKPIPLEELLEKNFPTEETNSVKYYDAIGKVNFLSPNPMEDFENHEKLYNVIPTSICEYKNDHLYYLFTNKGWEECLKTMGINSVELSEQTINDDTYKLKTRLTGLCKKTHITGQLEGVDFIFNGDHINVCAKEIAYSNGVQAVFCTMMNLSSLENVRKIDELETSLNFLYSIYDRVDLIDIENNKIEVVYLNSDYYQTRFEKGSYIESIKAYSETDIVEDEREKFLAFYDMSTIEERLKSEGKDYISTIFHTQTYNKGPRLQLYILIRVSENTCIRYLSCVRDINDKKDYFLLEG